MSLFYSLFTAADKNTNTVCASKKNYLESSGKIALNNCMPFEHGNIITRHKFRKRDFTITQRHQDIIRFGDMELRHPNNVKSTLQ